MPEQGIGFRVITPSADVVDLGTAFHVSVDEAGATEVHVSQGLVVARAVDSDGVVQVKRSEAARFEALSGDISTIPFRASNATRAIQPIIHDVATRPLPPGARVVFLGDRTTDRETHLLWIADAVRHLPESNRPKLFNAGLTFPLSFNDDDYRVQIAALSPTHAVLEFGPEIAAELDLARSPERFRGDILRLIRRLQRDGIEPILETGFPLGTSHPMSQGRVDEYNTILRALAAEHGLTLVDVDRWFRAASLPLDELVVPRGLFPATAGHREIAACIAATLGLPDLPPTEAPTTPLFPGAITAWHYRFVERGAQLTSAQAASLRPDASWTELALPQPDDELAQLTADKQHLVGYRDRQRGFCHQSLRRERESDSGVCRGHGRRCTRRGSQPRCRCSRRVAQRCATGDRETPWGLACRQSQNSRATRGGSESDRDRGPWRIFCQSYRTTRLGLAVMNALRGMCW